MREANALAVGADSLGDGHTGGAGRLVAEALAAVVSAAAAAGDVGQVQGTDNAFTWARKHGVKLAFGTDILLNPEMTQNQITDYTKLTKWFTPSEALKLATYDNAQLLALSGPRNPYPARWASSNPAPTPTCSWSTATRRPIYDRRSRQELQSHHEERPGLQEHAGSMIDSPCPRCRPLNRANGNRRSTLSRSLSGSDLGHTTACVVGSKTLPTASPQCAR